MTDHSRRRPATLVNGASTLMTAVGNAELLRMAINTVHKTLMQLVEGSEVGSFVLVPA